MMAPGQCSYCGSALHTADTCGDKQNLFNFQMQVPAEEQLAFNEDVRRKLARGIPADAPCCEYHQQMLNEVNPPIVAHHAGGSIATADHTIPRFKQTITTDTAFLPFCYHCLIKVQSLEVGQKPLEVDLCTCATYVTFSSCWYCGFADLELSKQLAIIERSVQVTEDKFVLKCECGNDMQGYEGARKCAGCYGVVTATPNRTSGLPAAMVPTISGDGIVFEPYTVVIKNRIQGHFGAHPQANGQIINTAPAPIAHGPPHHQDENILRFSLTPLEQLQEVKRRHEGRYTKGQPHQANSQRVSIGGARGQHADAIPSGSIPLFTGEQLKYITKLALECDQAYCAPGMEATPAIRAQVALKKNEKTRISPSALKELLKICGFDQGMMEKVWATIRKLNPNGWLSGEILAMIVLSSQTEGLA